MSRFRTTMWSHLQAAGEGEETALDLFVRRYRPPLIAFLRGRGLQQSEAEDVTQDVFMRLLSRDLLSRADASRGRFRSYLLGITLKVLGDRRRKERAQKRGGDLDRVPLEFAPPTQVAAEFETFWLRELMRRALEAVQEASPSSHELLGHASQGMGPSEIAEATGRPVGSIRVSLHRARKHLAEALREEVARYCSSDAEFEEEMSTFARFLGPS